MLFFHGRVALHPPKCEPNPRSNRQQQCPPTTPPRRRGCSESGATLAHAVLQPGLVRLTTRPEPGWTGEAYSSMIARDMRHLPTGVVTLLVTDVETPTRLLHALGGGSRGGIAGTPAETPSCVRRAQPALEVDPG